MARAHDLLAVAHAHGSPVLLLRVCLRSNLRREPGRWLYVSKFSGKPTPFPGSGPHSPPRWRTRGRRSDLSLHPSDEDLSPGTSAALCKKRAISGTFWPWLTAPGPGISAAGSCRTGLLPAPPSSRHTCRVVLAEPFNNIKKSGDVSMRTFVHIPQQKMAHVVRVLSPEFAPNRPGSPLPISKGVPARHVRAQRSSRRCQPS
jgi:hypothetical protein